MNNSTKAVQEIKSLMVKFGFLSEEPVLQSFKLEDDTIFQTEKLEAGKSIVKINEAFKQVNVENGTYKFKENFEVEVQDSKIVNVKEIFVAAKLKDGTDINIGGDAVAEGAKVDVVTPDATLPAPDGDYELADGTKFTTKDGIIVTVVDVANESKADETKEVPEAPAAEAPQQMDEMYNMLKEFVTKAHDKIQQMEEQMSKFNSEFEAFKKEPAAKRISDGKTEQFNKQEDTYDAKVAAIMALRNKK
jgi:hypothetical protein